MVVPALLRPHEPSLETNGLSGKALADVYPERRRLRARSVLPTSLDGSNANKLADGILSLLDLSLQNLGRRRSKCRAKLAHGYLLPMLDDDPYHYHYARCENTEPVFYRPNPLSYLYEDPDLSSPLHLTAPSQSTLPSTLPFPLPPTRTSSTKPRKTHQHPDPFSQPTYISIPNKESAGADTGSSGNRGIFEKREIPVMEVMRKVKRMSGGKRERGEEERGGRWWKGRIRGWDWG